MTSREHAIYSYPHPRRDDRGLLLLAVVWGGMRVTSMEYTVITNAVLIVNDILCDLLTHIVFVPFLSFIRVLLPEAMNRYPLYAVAMHLLPDHLDTVAWQPSGAVTLGR